MIGYSVKYLSWFTAAGAAGLLTIRGFRVDHWASAWSSATFPNKEVTPYLFGAAGLAVVLLFGYSVLRALHTERDALRAVHGVATWAELCGKLQSVGQHGRCASFGDWAQRQLILNPGTAPDSQGWLGRQLAASQHSSSIRTLANVLIVLGIAFTFEAIAKSTAALSGAVKQAAENDFGAAVGAKRGGPQAHGGNVEHLVAQANSLRNEIGKALDPLTVAFGANLNGILFTIDLLVLLAFLRLLDADATRQLQKFVLDEADPLLQAAALQDDPTHALMVQLNRTQVRKLGKLVHRLQANFNAELITAFSNNAKYAEAIAKHLEKIGVASQDIKTAAVSAVESTAARTAKALTKQVGEEFINGLTEFNRVVTEDLPRRFNRAGDDMAGAVRLAASTAVEEAQLASRKSLAEAGVVGDRLTAAAMALEHALDRAVAGLVTHTESASQHLADAGQFSGAALAQACKSGAGSVREAAQVSADLLRDAGVRIQADVLASLVEVRQELASERARLSELTGAEQARLISTAGSLRGVTDDLAGLAGRQVTLASTQSNLADSLTRAATALERSGQATALATEPLLASAERIAAALDKDGRNLLALQLAMAKHPAQLTEVQTRLGNVLTALATAERAMTAATAQSAVALQSATDALRAAAAASTAGAPSANYSGPPRRDWEGPSFAVTAPSPPPNSTRPPPPVLTAGGSWVPVPVRSRDDQPLPVPAEGVSEASDAAIPPSAPGKT